MSPAQASVAEKSIGSVAVVDAIDRTSLVAMLREKDRHIQELEAECRGLAEQLMAFQDEILKWVEFDR